MIKKNERPKKSLFESPYFDQKSKPTRQSVLIYIMRLGFVIKPRNIKNKKLIKGGK